MSYREHAPPAALAPWLECLWERRGDGAPVRVLPDGCIDIVWTEGAGTHLVGASTSAFLSTPARGTRVVGARMLPGAAPALLGVAAEEVRDAWLPVGEVWAGEGGRLAEMLDSGPDPIDVVRRVLVLRAARAERPDPLVRAAVSGLARPDVAIAALARELNVSERQLRRRVCGAVGYGPKRLARVLRLHRAVAAARAGGDLARVALDAGYADQAHFANECRSLAGIPPSALRSF